MAKSAIDANVNTQIFRKDWPMILALKRELAQISPVRLVLSSTGYTAGQVLGTTTTPGMFDKWSNVSGTGVVSCILFESINSSDQPATGGELARAVFSGFVYTNMLIDYNATAKSGLNARDRTDATLLQITQF